MTPLRITRKQGGRRRAEITVVVAIALQTLIFFLPLWVVLVVTAAAVGLCLVGIPAPVEDFEVVIDTAGIRWGTPPTSTAILSWGDISAVCIDEDDGRVSVLRQGRTIYTSIPTFFSASDRRAVEAAVATFGKNVEITF